MRVKVEGTHFVKDVKTGALLTTSSSVLMENEARKKLASRLNGKNEDINNLKLQVSEMSNDMREIKTLLAALLQQSKE
jgi:hypothetical protein